MRVNFFISRTGADASWAQWIAECLQEAHYTFILQNWDFKPGQDFIYEMDRAMRESERTIVILSRYYEKAMFTYPEWTNAIARDPTGYKSLLIPVRIDDILPEGIFNTRVFIDLMGLEEKEAKERLLAQINMLYKKNPKNTPQFPGTITTRFPGSLPPVWKIPYDRNPVFTGRKKELAKIRKHFEANVSPPLITALTGAGGIGKTALVIEYAHAYRGNYRLVWWLRGGHKESLTADMANLADALQIIEAEDSLETKINRALNWLSHHDKWLLILDAIDNPALAASIIPKGGDGHVLITSRSVNWRRFASVIEVKRFEEVEGVRLLSKRSGKEDEQPAKKLVALMGGLPLGIELAGAFIEQQGLEIEDYLDRIKRKGNLPDDDVVLRPPDYDHALNAVWAESFSVLREQSSVAMELLSLSAFLAPDDIPRHLLNRGASYLSVSLNKVANDTDKLVDLIAKPRSYSLVSTNEDGYSINRLIQAMIRKTMQQNEKEYWSGMAVLLLNGVLPKQVTDFRLWSRVGRLIEHAMEAAEHGIEYSSQLTSSIALLDRFVTYMADMGASKEDITEKRNEAIRQAEKLPEGPPAWLLNNQAVWLMNTGNKKEAAVLLERAIDVTRKKEGGNAPTLGNFFVNLGSLAKEEKEYEKAYAYFIRGLVILDTLPDWAEHNRAIGHGQLGEVILHLGGDRKSAAIHFKAAADGYAKALGPGSQEEILNRSFLASVMGEDPRIVIQYEVTPESIKVEEGKLLSREELWIEDAEKLLRKAWEKRSPGAAVELSTFLRNQQREEEGVDILIQGMEAGDSEAFYWFAREATEKSGLAAEEFIRASIQAGNTFSYYDLGLALYGDKERKAEVEDAFRKALEGGFEIARNDLGILLLEWPGREAEGEALLEEAGRFGQVRCWHNLANYLRDKQGREQDAIDYFYRSARAGYIKDYGYLAYYLIEKNKLKEALSVFREGVAAGLEDFEPHLDNFLSEHPEINDE